MKRFRIIGLIGLVVLAVASCDIFGGDAPELQVLAEVTEGEAATDMGPENEINFGKPGDGVNKDIVFTIRNNGTANLVLEGEGPDYVSVVDQNEATKPFSVLVGATTQSIGPGSEAKVTIRFVGQSDSTRYTAKLLIPSNDPEHPDYFLGLLGDGDGFF